MPEHTELEVDSVISRQNVAKEGWTTYYVDGTNGNDANNGLRWESAFKTIQHAIDVAESWAKIYVRNGTYEENVEINLKPNISLIGESSSDTIIKAASPDTTLTIYASPGVRVEHFRCEAYEDLIAIHCYQVDFVYLNDIRAIASGSTGECLALGECKNFHVENFRASSSFIGMSVVRCSQNIPRPSIVNCYFDSCWLDIQNSEYNIVSNCHFYNAGATYGAVRFYSDAGDIGVQKNLVTHCNFIDCAKCIFVDGDPPAANNYVRENYYSSHTNIDNGFGIATEPFVDDLTDPRPVVIPSGWLVLGLGGDTLESIKSEVVADTYTHPNDTSEHTVLYFTPDTQDIFISLDVSALTQKTEIREYEQIDGSHYRQISCKTYPDDFDSGTKAITIYFKQKNRRYKITMKSIVAEGASRDIPYVYRTDGKAV